MKFAAAIVLAGLLFVQCHEEKPSFVKMEMFDLWMGQLKTKEELSCVFTTAGARSVIMTGQ